MPTLKLHKTNLCVGAPYREATGTPCRNETQILRFRAVGYYDSPMGIYYIARYQVSSRVHFFLKQTFAKENL